MVIKCLLLSELCLPCLMLKFGWAEFSLDVLKIAII